MAQPKPSPWVALGESALRARRRHRSVKYSELEQVLNRVAILENEVRTLKRQEAKREEEAKQFKHDLDMVKSDLRTTRKVAAVVLDAMRMPIAIFGSINISGWAIAGDEHRQRLVARVKRAFVRILTEGD